LGSAWLSGENAADDPRPRRESLLLYVQTFVSGVLSAGVLTLIAIGFSLQWRSLKLVNLAHFSLVLLSAYVTYDLSTRTKLDPFLFTVIAVPAAAAVSMAFQWVMDYFAVTVFNSLLLTFGVFILVEGAITDMWGGDFLRISADISPWSTASFTVLGIVVPVASLIATVLAGIIVAAFALFIRNSYFGKALRAIAQDREIAVAYGVNYRRVASLLAAGNGAAAGLAGVLVAVSGAVYPTASEAWIGLVFAVVILGGIGSPVGALVSAVMIGAIMGLGSTKWGTSAAQLIMFVILILVLLWKTEGLFKRLRT
jgi:branched-chain amino acid transport system permease protein